ncbi:MAG: RNase adapter RapZ [Pseudomonadota bacterium]
MTDQAEQTSKTEPPSAPSVVLVTGMSGAGRSTAVAAFEDMGYEAVDNFPIGLIDQLVAPNSTSPQPIALGLAPGSRGFSVRALREAVETLRNRVQAGVQIVFLDCTDEKLLERYSETRRRHPLAPEDDPATGIARERDLLPPIRDQADTVIDTTVLTPHQLKSEMTSRFSLEGSVGLSVSVQSFSYKRGAPHEADMVLDCRFLQNPYWKEDLRTLDGRHPRIQGFVEDDPRFPGFFDRVFDLLLTLLPAYKDEGKAYFSIALGCSGGRHRSVATAEKLRKALAAAGWRASVRHRELDR